MGPSSQAVWRDRLVNLRQRHPPPELFLRGLGLVFAIAFASLLPQLRGLWGRQGIAPATRYLDAVHRALPSFVRWLRVPTVFWAGSSDGALIAVAVFGLLISLVLIAGFFPRPALAILWLLYLSFVSVGGVFLGFQWDTLLLETAVLAFVYAPGGVRLSNGRFSVAGRTALWLLLFKLMWGSGWVKLASGDPSWRQLTALRFHFWTQPLPGPFALWVARWPGPVLTLMTLAAVGIELVLPFAIFLGRQSRRVALVAFVLLQAGIALTGNYGFFNLLAALLTLPLLDDASPRWREAHWPQRIVAALLLVLVALPLMAQLSPTAAEASVLRTPLTALGPFESFNAYGLFAVMTTERPEIAIEGSEDGRTWTPYRLRYLPAPGTRPRQVAPYQPRLDWQLWFAALGRCEDNGWFLALARGLLEGSGPIEQLFASTPATPPRYLRTQRSQLTPTPEGSWHAGPPRPYCPVLMLRDGRLGAAALAE